MSHEFSFFFVLVILSGYLEIDWCSTDGIDYTYTALYLNHVIRRMVYIEQKNAIVSSVHF